MSGSATYAQTISPTFNTKDFYGNELPLLERLDSTKNHIILFHAFWHNQTNNYISQEFNKSLDSYRKEYNAEIIILNDNYFDIPHLGYNRVKDNQWDISMYFSNQIFDSLGIETIPTFYFIPAGTQQAIRVSSDFTKDMDVYYFQPDNPTVFKDKIKLTSIDNDCASRFYQNSTIPDLAVNGYHYFNIGQSYLRQGILTNNIYRYDNITGQESLLFDYQLEKCDSFTLTDYEGDRLSLQVQEVSNQNGKLFLQTDGLIDNGCSEQGPFILSPEFGSNAGYDFDIENGKIVTHLVCMFQYDSIVYLDKNLEEHCKLTEIDNTFPENPPILYPNPTSGIIHFSNLRPSETYNLSIYNSTGIKVLQSQISLHRSINLNTTPNGVYQYHLKSKVGAMVGQFVFIK